MGRRKQLSREEVLSAINEAFIKRGLPPTIEELRRALGVGSTRTVLRYLRWLEEEGDIERKRSPEVKRKADDKGDSKSKRHSGLKPFLPCQTEEFEKRCQDEYLKDDKKEEGGTILNDQKERDEKQDGGAQAFE